MTLNDLVRLVVGLGIATALTYALETFERWRKARQQ